MGGYFSLVEGVVNLAVFPTVTLDYILVLFDVSASPCDDVRSDGSAGGVGSCQFLVREGCYLLPRRAHEHARRELRWSKLLPGDFATSSSLK